MDRATRIGALVAAELARILDATRRTELTARLVEPRLETRTWDYGAEGELYPCWIVALAPEVDTAFAYCEHGFGPEMPWGAVFLGETSLGMDSQWHETLDEAFISHAWLSLREQRDDTS